MNMVEKKSGEYQQEKKRGDSLCNAFSVDKLFCNPCSDVSLVGTMLCSLDVLLYLHNYASKEGKDQVYLEPPREFGDQESDLELLLHSSDDIVAVVLTVPMEERVLGFS